MASMSPRTSIGVAVGFLYNAAMTYDTPVSYNQTTTQAFAKARQMTTPGVAPRTVPTSSMKGR